MSESTKHESTGASGGKTYGYQETTATDAGSLADEKERVVNAFDDFMDALIARGGGTGTTGTIGTTGATGATGTTGTTGTTGSGGSMGSSSGVGTTTSQPTGGEHGYGASESTEATEAASIRSQREAYRLDRARETERRARRQQEVTGGAAVTLAPLERNPHQSDSNVSPLTENREFGPAFGSAGRPTTPTIEKIAVPVTQRPETAPATGVSSSVRPIDAYYGSFGTALERAAARAQERTMLESVIGADDRVRVTNNEAYPWRCIASLEITAANGMAYIGTGWLVAPRLLLTAGHCVYMADDGGWVREIEVIPGRDGTQRPFGSAVCRDFRSVTGWTQDTNSDFDYAAILLPEDKRYGDQLGWFGYTSRPDDHLRGLTLNLAGYPGDGGHPPDQEQGSQWYHSRSVSNVLPRQITYEIDTYGGQSGAPVWEMTADSERYGVAIHTWGTSVNNGGTRITGDVFDNIVLWAGQVP